MPALLTLLPILLKVLPYALATGTAILVYLHIKNKGKAEEKAKLEAAQAEQRQKIVSQVQEAVNKDVLVDEKVKAQIEQIKKTEDAPPSDPTVFKF